MLIKTTQKHRIHSRDMWNINVNRNICATQYEAYNRHTATVTVKAKTQRDMQAAVGFNDINPNERSCPAEQLDFTLFTFDTFGTVTTFQM